MHKRNGKKGVYVNPNILRQGRAAQLIYDGLLNQSGVQQITAHYGVFQEGQWVSIEDMPMSKRPDGAFAADIIAPLAANMHVSFYDSASNWDNNGGENYSFPITQE